MLTPAIFAGTTMYMYRQTMALFSNRVLEHIILHNSGFVAFKLFSLEIIVKLRYVAYMKGKNQPFIIN